MRNPTKSSLPTAIGVLLFSLHKLIKRLYTFLQRMCTIKRLFPAVGNRFLKFPHPLSPTAAHQEIIHILKAMNVS